MSMSNFGKIGQSVAKISRCLNFSTWWPPPSWIFKFVKFNWQTHQRVSAKAQTYHHAIVVKAGHLVVEILQVFEFSKWPPPSSWIFEIAKFYWLLGQRGSRRITVPNFVKISQSVAKILRIFDFSRWRPPPPS